MELLVIEDDPVLGKALRKGFQESGHRCTWLEHGQDLQEVGWGQRFDCIVLDVMLPGRSGLEILRGIRAAGVLTPVLLLTALGSVEERVAGLTAGADDYMVKPFAFAELAARIEAVCRRSAAKPTASSQAGALQLELATRRAKIGSQSIELTPTECSLLELLMRFSGQVVTRKMLCEHLWEFDWEGTTNVIEVHVNRLREKLKKLTPEPMIQTVRGRGYALRATE